MKADEIFRYCRADWGTRCTRYHAQEQTPVGKAAAAACKMYYDYFRSDPTDLRLGQEALEAVRKLNRMT